MKRIFLIGGRERKKKVTKLPCPFAQRLCVGLYKHISFLRLRGIRILIPMNEFNVSGLVFSVGP